MKKLLTVFIIIILFMTYLNTICYAKTAVTKKNLQESFKKIIQNKESEDNFKIDSNTKITVDDNKIIVAIDGEESIVKYDLSNKPTFTSEIKVKNGMNYEEFEKEEEKLTSNILGYIAVSNIKGVKVEDSILYFVGTYLKDALASENTNKYIVMEENPEVTVSTEGKTIIKKSEFPDNVIKYVNSLYSKEKMSFNDKDKYNTFEWTIEKKDVTDDSCTLISTIKVNLNGKFSKIKGLLDNLGNEVKNYIEDSSKLPQTGKTIELVDILYFLIGISVISIIALIIMQYKYKKV